MCENQAGFVHNICNQANLKLKHLIDINMDGKNLNTVCKIYEHDKITEVLYEIRKQWLHQLN